MGCARAATPSRAPPFTASPAAQLVYNDSWCGDENLIPGTDTTNTEPTISWATCSSRCAAKGFDCAYFVWGVVTWARVPNVNRCALFTDCKLTGSYADGDPQVFRRPTTLTTPTLSPTAFPTRDGAALPSVHAALAPKRRAATCDAPLGSVLVHEPRHGQSR
jgi:hypothetical protein